MGEQEWRAHDCAGRRQAGQTRGNRGSSHRYQRHALRARGGRTHGHLPHDLLRIYGEPGTGPVAPGPDRLRSAAAADGRILPVCTVLRTFEFDFRRRFGAGTESVKGAWQIRWDFSFGGVTYLASWGNILFPRPLR